MKNKQRADACAIRAHRRSRHTEDTPRHRLVRLLSHPTRQPTNQPPTINHQTWQPAPRCLRDIVLQTKGRESRGALRHPSQPPPALPLQHSVSGFAGMVVRLLPQSPAQRLPFRSLCPFPMHVIPALNHTWKIPDEDPTLQSLPCCKSRGRWPRLHGFHRSVNNPFMKYCAPPHLLWQPWGSIVCTRLPKATRFAQCRKRQQCTCNSGARPEAAERRQWRKRRLAPGTRAKSNASQKCRKLPLPTPSGLHPNLRPESVAFNPCCQGASHRGPKHARVTETLKAKCCA